MPPDNEHINPAIFAASTRALLTEDPRRYRSFGQYWFFVKALLKRFYDRHQMPMLGNYEDPTVNARLPDGLSVWDMMERAVAEYATNAGYRMGSPMVEDDEGETFLISDPDVEG